MFAHILKFNPNHGEDGRFASEEEADAHEKEVQNKFYEGVPEDRALTPEERDKLDKMGTVLLFHGTAEKNVASILKNGLTIDHAGQGGADQWGLAHHYVGTVAKTKQHAASVFLTTRPDVAGMFARYAKQVAGGKGAILEVNMPHDYFKANVKMDEASNPVLGAVRFEGTIKPEWIKLGSTFSSQSVKADTVKFYIVIPCDDKDEVAKVNFAQILKFNPYHESDGRFGTGGVDNSDFSDTDRKIINYDAKKPLGSEGTDDLKRIEKIIPGAQYVPYSKTPFFEQLNKLQGTDISKATAIENKKARDALFAKQPIEQVPIDSLVFTQNVVNMTGVERARGNPNPNPAQVVSYEGKHYLMDGHHRTVGEIEDGGKSIRAQVLTIAKKVDFAMALKFNPYHDELGRFASADSSSNPHVKFVSIGAKFKSTIDKEKAAYFKAQGLASAQPVQEDQRTFTPVDRDDYDEGGKFFQRYDDLVVSGSLTQDETRAIEHYTASGYGIVNGFLRKGDADLTQVKYAKATIENLDTALAKTSIGQDTVLYRGINATGMAAIMGGAGVPANGKDWRGNPTYAFDDVKNTVGHTFIDKGYSSASFSSSFANNWGSSALFEMEVPKETKGLYVEPMSSHSGYGEFEYMFPRGTSYTVTGVSMKGNFSSEKPLIKVRVLVPKE